MSGGLHFVLLTYPFPRTGFSLSSRRAIGSRVQRRAKGDTVPSRFLLYPIRFSPKALEDVLATLASTTPARTFAIIAMPTPQ